MNIHEYQAKSLLKKYGVTVPRGGVAFSVKEAVDVAKALALDLKEPVWVVKSQIHAGGRGKGGGVKVVKSLEGVENEAKRMLGMQLVTHQTGPLGQKVQRLYVEARTLSQFACGSCHWPCYGYGLYRRWYGN